MPLFYPPSTAQELFRSRQPAFETMATALAGAFENSPSASNTADGRRLRPHFFSCLRLGPRFDNKIFFSLAMAFVLGLYSDEEKVVKNDLRGGRGLFFALEAFFSWRGEGNGGCDLRT